MFTESAGDKERAPSAFALGPRMRRNCKRKQQPIAQSAEGASGGGEQHPDIYSYQFHTRARGWHRHPDRHRWSIRIKTALHPQPCMCPGGGSCSIHSFTLPWHTFSSNSHLTPAIGFPTFPSGQPNLAAMQVLCAGLPLLCAPQLQPQYKLG